MNTEQTIAAVIEGLRESHATTTQGQWCKGKTTHQTVARCQAGQLYHVAEFRHSDDADFCEQAHASVPKLLEYISEMEAQLKTIDADDIKPLRKQAVPQGWKLVPVEPTEKMIIEGGCGGSAKAVPLYAIPPQPGS